MNCCIVCFIFVEVQTFFLLHVCLCPYANRTRSATYLLTNYKLTVADVLCVYAYYIVLYVNLIPTFVEPKDLKLN